MLAAASAQCSECKQKHNTMLTQLCLCPAASVLASHAWSIQGSVATASAAILPCHILCGVVVLSGLFSTEFSL